MGPVHIRTITSWLLHHVLLVHPAPIPRVSELALVPLTSSLIRMLFRMQDWDCARDREWCSYWLKLCVQEKGLASVSRRKLGRGCGVFEECRTVASCPSDPAEYFANAYLILDSMVDRNDYDDPR